MQTEKHLTMCAVLVAGLTVLAAATEVKSQLLAVGLDAPLSCTAQIGNSDTVTVEAGLTSLGTVPYPQTVPCVDSAGNPTSGLCSEYNLKFTYSSNPNHSFASLSTDLDLYFCDPSCAVESTPTAGDSTTGIGANVAEQRTIRFNSNASVLFARIITEKSAARAGTGGGRIGKITGACLVSGPGVPGNQFSAISVTQTQLVAGGQCLALLTYDALGNLIDVTTDTPGCFVSTDPVLVNGEPLRDNRNPNGITHGNGTCTTWGPPIPSPSRTICK